MKRKIPTRWSCPMAVAAIFAAPIATVMQHIVIGYVMMAAALLFFVKVVPFCRKWENMWMFFLAAICFIPMNIYLIFRYIMVEGLMWRLMFRSSAYFLLFSTEEIIMGAITRRLWILQRRLPYTVRASLVRRREPIAEYGCVLDPAEWETDRRSK